MSFQRSGKPGPAPGGNTAPETSRRHARRHALTWLLRGAGLLSMAAAHAAQFTLSPTRVHLDRGHATETLVLGNSEDREISFEVEVKRWRQGDDGQWALVPDDTLVVHPLVVTVPAGGKARFRVGTLQPGVAAEEAYRVELQQLPDPEPAQGASVELLTRMSIPVFVQPATHEARVALAHPRVDAGAVRVDLANVGEAYIAPQDSRLRLFDAGGRLLREEPLATEYVLAGAMTPLSRPLAAELCTRVERIELVLAAPALSASVAVPAGARQCSR